MSNEERKNRNIGLIASAGIHGGILLILFFLIAWRAPDPPLPEYGIQLNFGLDDQGSGDIQPEESNVTEEVTEESQPEEQKPQEETEVRPNEVQVAEQPVSKQESPVVVKEEKKEAKPEPVKEKKKEEEKPLAEYKKEEKKESKTDAKTDGGKTTTSHGDDVNKTGDKGDPEGSLDAKALYGKQGGGGGNGLALTMSGWEWAEKTRIPDVPDNANGRIIFEIECDQDGEIVGITTIERGLSPKAEQILKDEIRKNSLVRTAGGQAPARSKGRVVFNLKTN